MSPNAKRGPRQGPAQSVSHHDHRPPECRSSAGTILPTNDLLVGVAGVRFEGDCRHCDALKSFHWLTPHTFVAVETHDPWCPTREGKVA